jgi:dihydrofolate reductase
MRASVFVGASVDGFIARPNGGLDFLHAGEGGGEPVDFGFDAFLASVDALVMGRNTYDVVRAFPTWPYGTKPVVVLSSRLLDPAPAGAVVERMSGAPAEVVAKLAARGMEHLYVDGGITIQRFLRDGLITRLVISRVPVLIGSGIPLFGTLGQDVRLDHVATRKFPGGMIQCEYAVHATPGRPDT